MLQGLTMKSTWMYFIDEIKIRIYIFSIQTGTIILQCSNLAGYRYVPIGLNKNTALFISSKEKYETVCFIFLVLASSGIGEC